MGKYYVVYSEGSATWCWHNEAVKLVKHGWKLYGIASNEKLANHMLSKIAAF